MSHSETHARRVKKLTDGVRAYADSLGISPKTASLRVFKDGKELERLEGKGSTKPVTLEKYEGRLKSWKAGVDPDSDAAPSRQALSA